VKLAITEHVVPAPHSLGNIMRVVTRHIQLNVKKSDQLAQQQSVKTFRKENLTFSRQVSIALLFLLASN
jgi:hypothetical protein